MSEIVQFNLRRKDQMYGFLRFNEELKPYLPEIKQVNIELDEDNKPRTALNAIKAFYLNRGVVNHFTDPMLALWDTCPETPLFHTSMRWQLLSTLWIASITASTTGGMPGLMGS